LGVTSYSNAYKYIEEKADLVIFLGAAFNERTSYIWDRKLLQGKKIIQIDSDYTQLEKVFKADIAIQGDIREVLTALLNNIKNHPDSNLKKEYLPITENGKQESNCAVFKSTFSLVEKLFLKMEEHFAENITVFDDNIIFAQNFFNVASNNRYYPNSGVSSLGHAIPAAIGAQFADRKTTFAVLGDGGFQMCCMEIMTAVNYSIPLNIVMFNNSTMGLIRKNQFQQYHERFINCDFINPDYQALAQSFGINHQRVENEDDLNRLFESTDFSSSINLIEVMIDKDAFPNYSSRR
ncbi:MAG: thiamine pyrophosphate-dependent enzyme, partial [Gammaproteobacteria bacterium]|nr:thiamine pyrophosphate-dependent enzyme [Gammaproteobacteria bacterium]